jgi:hypothetical protein
MCFKQWHRVESYAETTRKRCAVLTSRRRGRERLPLLERLIAEQQPCADTVMADRTSRHQSTMERRPIFGGYLLDFLHGIETERINPADPLWQLDPD